MQLLNVFNEEELQVLRGLPEVVSSYERLSRSSMVYFQAEVPASIQQKLQEEFNITLPSRLPFRWIRGDTRTHADKGIHSFENTHLVYLTDGEGQFHIGEDSYPIQAGTGFVFSEGTTHSVDDTNGTERLLLGPMSESGFAVGSNLNGDGATDTIYIRYDSDLDEKQYKINDGDWNTLYLSTFVVNTNPDPANNPLKVLFTTNIPITSTEDYLICDSDGIQFGSTTLNANGTRPTIQVSVDNYDGFIRNGSSGTNGYNNIYIYNLVVDGSGYTQSTGAGWLGRQYFGLGTTNNYIINCFSSGDIYGGGILGHYAENVTLIGCSSDGEISNTAGGIVGAQVEAVIIQQCWSRGAISGNGAGGIVGANTISCTVEKCYSTGIISGNNAGGIVGSNAGSDSVTITKCHSSGDIQGGNAGGICGSLAPASGVFSVTITNCYSTGNLTDSNLNSNGGICGALIPYGSGAVNATITNCYTTGTGGSTGYIIGNVTATSGTGASYTMSNNFSETKSGLAGSWNDVRANSALTGTPSSSPDAGTTWASYVSNTAYELVGFGATPYQLQNVSGNALIQSYSQTVQQGGGTNQVYFADSSGNSFVILKKSGGGSSITINQQTGKISTTSETEVGTYTLTIGSGVNFSITTFVLTVTKSSTTIPALRSQQYDFTTYNNLRLGNQLVFERLERPNQRFNSFEDYYKYKRAMMLAGKRI